MWNKLFWLSGIILALALFIYLSRGTDQGSTNSTRDPATITRQADRVVMFERKRESGKVLEVSARQVDETDAQVAHLKDFILTQSDDLSLSGSEAVYDRTRSVLELKGRVHIKRSDGSRAVVDGLLWDRHTGVAHTDNPLSYEGNTGLITADKAEFADDFTKIAFVGRVHARIMQDILAP